MSIADRNAVLLVKVQRRRVTRRVASVLDLNAPRRAQSRRRLPQGRAMRPLAITRRPCLDHYGVLSFRQDKVGKSRSYSFQQGRLRVTLRRVATRQLSGGR